MSSDTEGKHTSFEDESDVVNFEKGPSRAFFTFIAMEILRYISQDNGKLGICAEYEQWLAVNK